MTNFPILYTNIMDGLPSDFAREVFLWAVERPGEDRMCYRAERVACEAHTLVERIMPMLQAGFALQEAAGRVVDPSRADDLMGFILTRHANWRLGGNVHPTYAGGAQ